MTLALRAMIGVRARPVALSCPGSRRDCRVDCVSTLATSGIEDQHADGVAHAHRQRLGAGVRVDPQEPVAVSDHQCAIREHCEAVGAGEERLSADVDGIALSDSSDWAPVAPSTRMIRRSAALRVASLRTGL